MYDCSKITNSHTNIAATLNGAIAGLVAITAEPLTPSMGQAVIIGAIGGIICMYGMKLLDMLKIDDVVGAYLHTCFRNMGYPGCRLDKPRCIISYAVHRCSVLRCVYFSCSYVVWTIIKITIGLRQLKKMKNMDLI